jgi:hypothetical protein
MPNQVVYKINHYGNHALSVQFSLGIRFSWILFQHCNGMAFSNFSNRPVASIEGLPCNTENIDFIQSELS